MLATVLFTDTVDSTEHASRLGDRQWQQLLDRHNRIVRELLERHRGEEIKTFGDGFLATFDGPARAVRCARDIVAEMAALGIAVRCGLHTGEVRNRRRRRQRHRGAHRVPRHESCGGR